MKQIIEQLKERRQQLGLSQSQLAEMVGIKQPNIARMESGNHSISVATLERITTALECTITIKVD